MRVTISGWIVWVLAVALAACAETPLQPGRGPQPRDLRVFVDTQTGFDTAVRELGARIVLDFEDVDPGPMTDTIAGRPPFDRLRYENRGIVFSNPHNRSLYLAPRGLFWNPTNSLSVGRFPNDPLDRQTEAPFVEDDDLEITFTRGCSAAAFTVIDNTVGDDESLFNFVEFVGEDGRLLRRVECPRAFVGMVAPLQRVLGNVVEFRIGRISISEAASDGDDVTYDDVICIR